jgi:hypothetical protein
LKRRFATLKRQKIAETPVNPESLDATLSVIQKPCAYVLRGGGTPSPTPETGALRGVSSPALSVLSAVVSERFVNFLPNFGRQFPEKVGEEARDRCRIHGIGFEFFDIPMNFPAFLFRYGSGRNHTLYCRCG